jgi:hypothetical protein
MIVYHRPLSAGPSDRITFVVDTSGLLGIKSVKVYYFRQGDSQTQTASCVPMSGATACSVTVGTAPPGELWYTARVTGWDANRNEVTIDAGNGFLTDVWPAAAQLSAHPNAVYRLRVPAVDDGMVGVALARDPSGGAYGEQDARADTEACVYDGVFREPMYRWRNDQVGFWFARREAYTRPYSHGWDTRCAQKPWPREMAASGGVLPDQLGRSRFDVLGVVHRYSSAGNTVGPAAAGFRDCSGVVVGNPEKRSFSSRGTEPLTFLHELGHAGFGLSDEYYEDESTRRVVPGFPPRTENCDCCPADSGGSGGVVVPGSPVGGGSALVTLGGPIIVFPPGEGDCLPGQPPCPPEGPPLPVRCYENPAGGCGPLSHPCLADLLLESGAVGALGKMANAFPDEDDCLATLAAALAHVGQEVSSPPHLPVCVQLCGPGTDRACPCDPGGEVWVVDVDPDAVGTKVTPLNAGDVMWGTSSDRHGWTCDLCMDMRYCLLWELERGATLHEAVAHCLASSP